jgi:hypothetical protein
MVTPAPSALTSQASLGTHSAFKRLWFKKDTKNNALAHSITAAKALQDASDLTGVPFLKSIVGGLVIILESVEVCDSFPYRNCTREVRRTFRSWWVEGQKERRRI